MSLSEPAYDPFRRHDSYGTAGAKPQPISELALLACLTVLVLPVKVFGAMLCVVCFYAFCRLSTILPRDRRDNAVASVGKVACRLCLFSLGFWSITWERPAGTNRQKSAEPCVIVSNHCSWIDILVHMSRFFPAFVARDSTKNLMLIGLISKKMGCLFVDRERKDANGSHVNQGVGCIVKERIRKAANGQSDGQRPMLLFPEGTTTNGRYLLPFKTGAFLAGCPVQPVILKYAQGRVSPAWESIQALRHIWLVLCIPFHSLKVVELPVYTPSESEAEDPVLFAKNVRKYMLEHSGLKPSGSTLAEKREFHSLLQGEEVEVMKKSE